MARRSPRPEATQEKILTPLKERCEQRGQPLWVANHSHRTVTTLSGLWKLTLVVRQCIEPTCPRFHQRYRPEEEGRWALPHGEFGLEVIALIGQWRFREHHSVPEMHQALLPVVCGRGIKGDRMRAEEGEKKMTKRIEVARAPAPLEEYIKHFDPLFGKSNQREGFRQYLEGLLLPSERHKMLTGLVNTEPVVGAQLPRAQKLQWFLSESDWDERKVQAERLTLLREDATTAPTTRGVLVIDETGDRKDGHKTAHVGRQYLGNLGKIDNGVVSVTSLWADEQVYYPLEIEPYTPESYFAKGRDDPDFRTKLKIALQLVGQAIQQGWPFRAVVADSFYDFVGE
jgi:hypothetical protein